MQAEALPPLQILWFRTYPDMLSLKQRKCLTDLFSSFNLMTGLPAPHRAVANRYDWNERARMLFDVVGAKNPLKPSISVQLILSCFAFKRLGELNVQWQPTLYLHFVHGQRFSFSSRTFTKPWVDRRVCRKSPEDMAPLCCEETVPVQDVASLTSPVLQSIAHAPGHQSCDVIENNSIYDIHIYIYLCTCICICIAYIYIHMYICIMYIYIYIHTYIHIYR